jgi:8-oxo-dGTP pyrophosphatase MutT (NUDIX family)
VPRYRGCYSLFGGSVDADEDEFNALERELMEELEPEAARKIFEAAHKVEQFQIKASDVECTYTLFESVLPSNYLSYLSGLDVKEGRGVLVARKKLAHLDFIWGLDKVRDFYLVHQ